MKNKSKTISIVCHLSILLARTGFGLLIPLMVFLTSKPLFNKKLQKTAFSAFIFQAKVTFTYLLLQFLAVLYQIISGYITSPKIIELNYSPYNPIMVISLVANIILTGGVIFGIIAAVLATKSIDFGYPRFWFKSKK
jgi:hypothetical protein